MGVPIFMLFMFVSGTMSVWNYMVFSGFILLSHVATSIGALVVEYRFGQSEQGECEDNEINTINWLCPRQNSIAKGLDFVILGMAVWVMLFFWVACKWAKYNTGFDSTLKLDDSLSFSGRSS